MRQALLMTFVVLTTAAACGNSQGSDGNRVILGVVVDIKSGSGFGEVESFTIKDGAEEFEIFVDPEVTYDFPLAHLNSHRAGAEAVRVEAESTEGKLVAVSISDA